MKINNKQFYIYFLVFVLFFSQPGCSSRRAVTKGEERVNLRNYSSLFELCQDNDLDWNWDGFDGIITVKNLKSTAKLYIGSSLVLFANQVHDLRSPVVIAKGKVMVPKEFTELFAGQKMLLNVDRARKVDFSIRKIVIDAGHGGKDPGAIGVRGNHEKDIVLDIAKRLAEQLQANGVEVVLTRQTDVFHPLADRSEIANKEKADFFISIHANAANARSANGFEAYYLCPDYDDFSKAVQIRENAVIKYEENADYKKSSDLNATLWDMILSENRIESMEMANSISNSLQKSLRLRTRYIRGANFYVLKGAHMPAVLLEVGYLTNPQEAARLNNPYYRQMLAEAIVAGILEYKTMFELSKGFSQ
jgi:N-acetylmuramoyl-L-alanine amidase